MLCIIQSRMSSQRLPGKMMMDIGGRVLIGRVIDRVRLSKKVSKIIVATSDHPSDDPIEQFCEVENIICYRGSLNNVAKRFMEIVLAENALSFVRINGDSPLIDPELIDCAISYFELGDNDLVTNVGVRTFPKGQSVEVILTNVFVSLYNELTTNEQREHVTKAFYERPENFRIMNFTSGGNFNSINMCIDTSEDKRNIEVVLKNVGREIGNWKDLSLLFSTLL
jgi:spore coat polysaccharide biosynthesis protein SpsF